MHLRGSLIFLSSPQSVLRESAGKGLHRKAGRLGPGGLACLVAEQCPGAPRGRTSSFLPRGCGRRSCGARPPSPTRCWRSWQRGEKFLGGDGLLAGTGCSPCRAALDCPPLFRAQACAFLRGPLKPGPFWRSCRPTWSLGAFCFVFLPGRNPEGIAPEQQLGDLGPWTNAREDTQDPGREGIYLTFPSPAPPWSSGENPEPDPFGQLARALAARREAQAQVRGETGASGYNDSPLVGQEPPGKITAPWLLPRSLAKGKEAFYGFFPPEACTASCGLTWCVSWRASFQAFPSPHPRASGPGQQVETVRLQEQARGGARKGFTVSSKERSLWEQPPIIRRGGWW